MRCQKEASDLYLEMITRWFVARKFYEAVGIDVGSGPAVPSELDPSEAAKIRRWAEREVDRSA